MTTSDVNSSSALRRAGIGDGGTGASAASPRRSLSSLSAASTTAAALSFSSARLEASKMPIVVEIGEKLTKVGYANELVPRAIIRTEVLDELQQRRIGSVFDLDSLTADDPPDELIPPAPAFHALHQFILKLYVSYLLATPSDRSVLIVENVLASQKWRRALATVFLERLGAVALLFAPSPLMATFPYNVTTALVVDLGYREAQAIPILEGVTLLHQMELTRRATGRLEQRTRELLHEHARVQDKDGGLRELSEGDKDLLETLNIVEDVVVRFLFVTPMARGRRIQAGEKNEKQAPDVRLPFKTEFLIVPGHVRESAAEVLFEEHPKDGDLGEELTLPQLVHHTIAKCSIDMRTPLFGSLLFVGGLSQLQGLLARIREEIIDLASRKGLKNANHETVKFIFSREPSFDTYAAWLGGSMFGSLTDVAQLRTVVTREEWAEKKRLPDWTDFIVQEKAPEGKGRV